MVVSTGCWSLPIIRRSRYIKLLTDRSIDACLIWSGRQLLCFVYIYELSLSTTATIDQSPMPIIRLGIATRYRDSGLNYSHQKGKKKSSTQNLQLRHTTSDTVPVNQRTEISRAFTTLHVCSTLPCQGSSIGSWRDLAVCICCLFLFRTRSNTILSIVSE